MNHCVLEVEVQKAPTVRYTQNNQTPIAEMEVMIQGLRAEDPIEQLKVVGWGNMAQDLQSNIQTGQRLILEGRLRMNTVPRTDGTKEKQAEFTLSKYHIISRDQINPKQSNNSSAFGDKANPSDSNSIQDKPESVNWNATPLVPDTDDIPF